jgi:hypothetical protein
METRFVGRVYEDFLKELYENITLESRKNSRELTGQ